MGQATSSNDPAHGTEIFSTGTTPVCRYSGNRSIVGDTGGNRAPKSRYLPGFYSPVFLGPKKDTQEMRMIIDLKILKKEFLQNPPKYKMESLSNLRTLIRPHSKFISIDLKDAYLHILIHPRSQKSQICSQRLKISISSPSAWNIPSTLALHGNDESYTKLSPSLEHRHSRISGRFFGKEYYHSDFHQADQVHHPCVYSFGSNCASRQIRVNSNFKNQFLGAILDSRVSHIYPPPDRWLILKDRILHLISAPPTSLPSWMSLLGSLTSIQDFTQRGRIHLRECQVWINQNRHLDLDTLLPFPQKLLWWTNEANILSGAAFRPPPPDLTMYTDASTLGWGAHMGHLQLQGIWSDQEKSLHINVLEMLAIVRALEHWSWCLHSKAIMVATDNSTVVCYVNKQGGTRSHQLLCATQKQL
ncbi:uncharacterized protein LOC124253801 [Haliotis rubra]|uniref:uncharacterized protein LOC124253801 n=1 Tax=Haliotis rubra TaxID=36100 RepID=UPI001EE602FD|nr:uncharacterized protein LOC124253801 [Haliotis rubra]